MEINEDWHKKNPMPKNPSFEERVKWHKKHVQHCGCREFPEKLKREMDKVCLFQTLSDQISAVRS